MADPDYKSLNVYPETHQQVVDLRNDHRLSSIDAAVSLLLDAYTDAADDAEREEFDQSDMAREVAARIDYEELARKTADNIRSDLR